MIHMLIVNRIDDFLIYLERGVECLISYLPHIILIFIVTYLFYACYTNFRMSGRKNLKKEKVLIQGVHGSGKTTKLLFETEFIETNAILNEAEYKYPFIYRVSNIINLEHDFRIKMNGLRKRKTVKDM